MNRTIAVTACLGMALCFQTPSFAAGRGPTAVQGFQLTPKKLLKGEHTVAAVYVNTANPGTSIANETFVTFDETTVRCDAAKCILAINAMQQAGPSDAIEPFATVVYVDGNPVDGGPFLGSLSTSAYVGISWQGTFPVSKGKHTVTWDTFGYANYSLDQWSDSVSILE